MPADTGPGPALSGAPTGTPSCPLPGAVRAAAAAPSHQSQLRVGTRVHAKLEVTGAEAQHGASLPGQDRGADEGIGQAGPRRHRHQVGAGAVLAVQGVDEGRQLVCVGFLGQGEGLGALVLFPRVPR